MLEQVHVGTEGQDRTEEHQVSQRAPASRGGHLGHALAGQRAAQQQCHAAYQHLGGAGHGALRQRQALAPHRTKGPRRGGEQDQCRAHGAGLQVGAEVEHADADQAQGDPRPFQARIALTEQQAEHQGEQRYGRHRQRRHSRRHAGVLGHGHATIATAEQQKADRPRRTPLGPGRRRHPAPAQEPVQQAARDDETHPGHEHRRPGLDADAYEQVGGAPYQVQGQEGTDEQEREATGGRHGKVLEIRLRVT
ncbi:hypothetical protein D3C81_431250 [compost metagenome]